MELFDILAIRKSSRAFTGEQITEEQLNKLLYAAKMAPVGSNQYKDIHLTVVQDQDVLKKLAEAACIRRLNKTEMANIAASVENITDVLDAGKAYDPFYKAPTVIFISHRKQTLQPGIEYTNVGGIANVMHLAAVDLGLGSCLMWYALESMRVMPELDHTELLGLPEDFEPLFGLAVGPIEEPLKERDLNLNRITVNRV